LISFFLRYLIRSRVFPEPEYERPIKRALEVSELARIELPNSWKMGRALPDAFSDGCKGLWGSKQPQWLPPADPSQDRNDGPERQGLDDAQGPSWPNETSTATADAFAHTETEPLVGGGWGTAATGGEDSEDWGMVDAWGDAHATAAIPDNNDNDNPHPIPSELLPPIIEAPPTWDFEPPTLLPLLGPTALPLTHTTGVVEQSTRRIVRVDPPRGPRLLAQNAPAAEAVEEDLLCRFSRVVLAPWERLDPRTYEAGSDVLPPTMLRTSLGAAVLDDETEGEGHRPWKDEIGVLVDPKVVEVFVAGKGLGGVWGEIGRVVS